MYSHTIITTKNVRNCLSKMWSGWTQERGRVGVGYWGLIVKHTHTNTHNINLHAVIAAQKRDRQTNKQTEIHIKTHSYIYIHTYTHTQTMQPLRRHFVCTLAKHLHLAPS